MYLINQENDFKSMVNAKRLTDRTLQKLTQAETGKLFLIDLPFYDILDNEMYTLQF